MFLPLLARRAAFVLLLDRLGVGRLRPNSSHGPGRRGHRGCRTTLCRFVPGPLAHRRSPHRALAYDESQKGCSSGSDRAGALLHCAGPPSAAGDGQMDRSRRASCPTRSTRGLREGMTIWMDGRAHPRRPSPPCCFRRKVGRRPLARTHPHLKAGSSQDRRAAADPASSTVGLPARDVRRAARGTDPFSWRSRRRSKIFRIRRHRLDSATPRRASRA